VAVKLPGCAIKGVIAAIDALVHHSHVILDSFLQCGKTLAFLYTHGVRVVEVGVMEEGYLQHYTECVDI